MRAKSWIRGAPRQAAPRRAAVKGDLLTGSGFLQGLYAALRFPPHGGRDKFFIRKTVPHQVHIDMISRDHVAFLHGTVGLKGHLVHSARTDPHHDQLSPFLLHPFSPILQCHDLLFTNIYDENYACCRAYTLPARSKHSESARFAPVPGAKRLLPHVCTLAKCLQMLMRAWHLQPLGSLFSSYFNRLPSCIPS